MSLTAKTLEVPLADSGYSLSARRLCEHTELGQTNPFALPVSKGSPAAAFIDVIRHDGRDWSLTGATLAGLRRGGKVQLAATLGGALRSPEVARFERNVSSHLAAVLLRTGHRMQETAFLPIAATAPFGISFMHSGLQQRLLALGSKEAPAAQWRGLIENMRERGLRLEELERSGLRDVLRLAEPDWEANGVELAGICDFSELRLSVIPMVRPATSQLRFTPGAPQGRTRATRVSREESRLHQRSIALFDPALGYRVERVQQAALWGTDTVWQAVAPDGQVLSASGRKASLTADAASKVAARHAAARFPKTVALGRWSKFAWTGGQEYREWLITLPHHARTFFSSHFPHRNVLAHLRCDVREGSEGERVLLLHEVQSDWAQKGRRHEAQEPPFMREWTTLALKLALLHAAHRHVDAVVWTQGRVHVHRYGGLGAGGLLQLYDRTLPREAARVMRPWNVACEPMRVYVPADFQLRQTEHGYEVLTPGGEVVGTATTFEGARQLLPDGARETLRDVHAVRLSAATRESLLAEGLPAWG